MLKPIIFCDFDGTLCFDRFWRSLPETQYGQVQELLFRSDSDIVGKWMIGGYTSEEVNTMIGESLSLRYEDLWTLFVRDCETMRVSQEALDTLHVLHSYYTVILLTMNMDCFTRFTVPALHLDEYFDHISNSFYDGLSKTEDNGKIFRMYAERFDAPMRFNHLFDDSEKACAVFSGLGGAAHTVSLEHDIMSHLQTLIRV